MDVVQSAIAKLKKTASKGPVKERKRYTESIGQIASHFVLFQSSSISLQASQKLAECFRAPFLPFYSAFPLAALQVTSALFHMMYHRKILNAIGMHLDEQRKHWDTVVNALLLGVLDFLDRSESDSVKHAIGTALYPGLCDICFSLSAPMISADLRCNAYSLLSDSAAGHTSNQSKLRDENVLGSGRLGAMIWRTKDYLALESLLNLFARLLPSTKGAGGRSKRAAFIRSVFLTSPPPEVGDVGQRVVDILENVSSQDWDDTAIKIVETFAQANLTFPQPFAVEDVTACGEIQPINRIYADNKVFLANVLVGDDQFESFEAPYSTIAKIQCSDAGSEKQRCTVELTAPPIIGKEPVAPQASTATPATLVFLLASKDVQRFQRALHARKLDKRAKLLVPPKLSLAKSGTLLEFDADGKPVAMSQEQRIEAVAEFYGTQRSGDEISSPQPSNNQGVAQVVDDLSRDETHRPTTDSSKSNSAHLSSTAKATTSSTKQTTSLAEPAQQTLEFADPITPPISGLQLVNPPALTRTGTQQIRAKIFGTSDEELSEISEADSLPNTLFETSRRPPAAEKKSLIGLGDTLTAARRPPARRRVLDSDDDTDDPPVNKTSASKGNPTKKMLPGTADTSEDEIEEIIASDKPPYGAGTDDPILLDDLSQGAPATPPRRPGPAALARSVARSVPEVSGKTDAAPAGADAILPKTPAPQTAAVPGTQASAPAVVEGDHVNSQSLARPAEVLSVISVDPVLPVTPPQTTKKPPSKASQRPERGKAAERSVAPPSSSPVPVVQTERKSIRANLRKKDQKIPASSTASHVKVPKRKRSADDQALDDSPAAKASDDATDGPAARKKPKKVDESTPPAPENKSDAQVLRPRTTAASRATKTYRAKKDRLSSPATSRASAFVDYDALPKALPSSSTGKTPSSPLARSADKGAGKKNALAHVKADAAVDATAPARRTRAAAMKDKENKAVTATPAVTEAKKARAKQAAPNTKQNAPPTPDTTVLGDDSSRMQDDTSIGREAPNSVELKKAALGGGLALPSEKSTASVTEERNKSKGKKSSTAPWAVAPFAPPAHEVAVVDTPPPEVPDQLHDAMTSSDALVTAATLDDPFLLHADDGPPDDTLMDFGSFAEGAEAAAILSNNGFAAQPPAEVVVKPAPTPKKAPLMTISAVRSPPPLSSSIEEVSTAPAQDTIDLTLDSPPKTLKAIKASTPPAPSPLRSFVRSLNSSVDEITHSTPFQKAGKRAQRSVTFDPVVQERQPSLVSVASTEDEPADLAHYVKSPLRVPAAEPPAPVKRASPKSPSKKAVPQKIRLQRSDSNEAHSGRAGRGRRSGDMPGDDDIVDVLNEIQEAILQRITKKLDGVRHEVRVGRDALAAEAASDLMNMRAESVEKFNGLIDLEAEYAKFGSAVAHGLEDMVKINKEVCGGLKQALQDHDRRSLSKKMPAGLCPALPASMQKFVR